MRRVREELALFPVVAILGVRQCGKTTLAKSVGSGWDYFDLENSEQYDAVTGDYAFFFEEHPTRTIIDEVQAAPELLRNMRGAIDSQREKRGRYIITGSSAPELKHAVAESLAGRVAIVELGTLKMNERHETSLSSLYSILSTLPPPEHVNALGDLPVVFSREQVMNHFLRGGYPEPSLRGGTFFDRWMTHYHSTYLNRDVRRLFPGLNLESYRLFISMLANLSGMVLNRSEVARSLGVSEKTVRNYLEIAAGTYIWRQVPSFEKSSMKSIVKMPRGHFCDSGLLNHLLRIRSLERLYAHPGVGAAFEGFVSEELIQGLNAVSVLPWDYHFYRTRNGAEVDLVLTSPDGDCIPVEIKFGVATKRSHLASLSRFVEQEKLAYGILINNSSEIKKVAPKIIQIPVGCL